MLTLHESMARSNNKQGIPGEKKHRRSFKPASEKIQMSIRDELAIFDIAARI
jgi:hypothetical protein